MSLELYKSLVAEFCDFDEFLSSKPPLHYKVYKIPKRTIGFRTIAQPTAKLKNVQRKLLEILESKVQLHPRATAYRKGANIRENALIHVKSNYLLKVDLENFFNSLTPQMLHKALSKQNIELDQKDKFVIEQIAFWNRSRRKNGRLILSVGAPSSPFISNLIMYQFDIVMNNICCAKNVNYSRYADDMTFSTMEKDYLLEILNELKSEIKKIFGSQLSINEPKTVFSSKAHNRHITGVTLTNDNKVSIGRERRRYISALVHKFKFGLLSVQDIFHLKGLISYARHIESGFYRKLQKKYGKEVLSSLIKYSMDI
jgi:RNA-directed DNA polymerase